MTPPEEREPPPWLDKAGELFEVSDELYEIIGETQGWERGDIASKDLPAWLAWRSRVAEALGLVDPVEMEASRIVALASAAGVGQGDYAAVREAVVRDRQAHVDRAIAAELRRLADEEQENWRMDHGPAPYDLLRARADELDPPTGG